MSDWLPVAGWPNYEVCSDGRVRSRTRLLRPQRVGKKGNHPGYYAVRLYNSGRSKNIPVHVLVLEAFVGPRPTGRLALHKNDNPQNNELENLYWGTPSQNVHDQVNNGNHGMAKKTKCKFGHVFSEENTSVRGRGRRCKICHREAERKRRRNVRIHN
jgi:hypothetical protein